MNGYLFIFSAPAKRVWSTKQGRYVKQDERNAELAVERTRNTAIEAAVAEKLGWPKGYLLYVDPQLGVNCPDGRWLPYDQLEKLREEAARSYDKCLWWRKIGMVIAVYGTVLLAGACLAAYGSDTLKALMLAAAGVGGLFWLMTQRG